MITNRVEARQNDTLMEHHMANFARWAVLNTSETTSRQLASIPEERRQIVLAGILHQKATEYLDKTIYVGAEDD